MSVVLLRHASAGDRGAWDGDDVLRPLDDRGLQQALALRDLRRLGITRIASSPYARCVGTVEPLAAALAIEIEIDARLSEGAAPEEARALLAEHDGLLACTHGDIVEALLGRSLKKGAAAVVVVEGGALRVVEELAAPVANRLRHTAEVNSVLVIDVGGSHVKVLVTGETVARRALSGRRMRAENMVDAVKTLAEGWTWDAVSIGIPAPVHGGRIAAEPVNLGGGWVGFDFAVAFAAPVRVVNDAAMQALGSYQDGRMLFLGLGTGLGSALVVEGLVQPMELAHLPYRKGTFEDYVGEAALRKRGKKRWRADVADVVATLSNALEPDYVVLGGGNATKLGELPESVTIGENTNAFVGGFRLWAPDAPARIIG